MIFDSIDKLYLYEASFPSLKTVAEILSKENLAEKKPGAYTTNDKNCRYNICEYTTVEGEKDFEIHKNEADVQIMISGEEYMTAPQRKLAEKAGPYDPEKDIHFVSGNEIVKYKGCPGYFAIFFPGEPHAPGIAVDKSVPAKKVVFKLKI